MKGCNSVLVVLAGLVVSVVLVVVLVGVPRTRWRSCLHLDTVLAALPHRARCRTGTCNVSAQVAVAGVAVALGCQASENAVTRHYTRADIRRCWLP